MKKIIPHVLLFNVLNCTQDQCMNLPSITIDVIDDGVNVQNSISSVVLPSVKLLSNDKSIFDGMLLYSLTEFTDLCNNNDIDLGDYYINYVIVNLDESIRFDFDYMKLK